MNADAPLAFEQSLIECKALLEKLESIVEEHLSTDPEHIHWGHVGDAEHLKTQLQSMIQHHTVYGVA